MILTTEIERLRFPLGKNESVEYEILLIPACKPDSIASYLIERSSECYFYRSPDDSFSFIFDGLVELDEDQYRTVLEHINNSVQATHYKTSHYRRIPFLFQNRFYNINSAGPLWGDFTGTYFLPRSAVYTEGNSSYFISLGTGKSVEDSLLWQIVNSTLPEVSELPAPDTTSAPAAVDFEEGKEEWIANVEKVKSKMQELDIPKVVMSRAIKSLLPNFNVSPFFLRLKDHVFTHRFVYKRDSSIFLGASPELLLSYSEGVVTTEALAGTAPKARGEEDGSVIMQRLSRDDKELHEHQIVTDYIIRGLHTITRNIRYAPVPQIKSLLKLYHLWTPIQASDISFNDIPELVDILFPTPATCGYPKEKAQELISQYENYSRGLYSGLIGWYTLGAEAMFFVPLRSALYKDSQLHVFSGGGIVAESDSEKEFIETTRKAESVINLLVQ